MRPSLTHLGENLYINVESGALFLNDDPIVTPQQAVFLKHLYERREHYTTTEDFRKLVWGEFSSDGNAYQMKKALNDLFAKHHITRLIFIETSSKGWGYRLVCSEVRDHSVTLDIRADAQIHGVSYEPENTAKMEQSKKETEKIENQRLIAAEFDPEDYSAASASRATQSSPRVRRLLTYGATAVAITIILGAGWRFSRSVSSPSSKKTVIPIHPTSATPSEPQSAGAKRNSRAIEGPVSTRTSNTAPGSAASTAARPNWEGKWFLEFGEESEVQACQVANRPDLKTSIVVKCNDSLFSNEPFWVRLGPADDRTELDRIRKRHLDERNFPIMLHHEECSTPLRLVDCSNLAR
jgi:DNA-binding winged helix-turn-helix (wHTH) protein